MLYFCFVKQKTAYEMRISDWSSDVCSSDLTASDSHLWSETYDREIKDVFAIQDDIARNIADALQVALGPRERRALQNVATADARAYDFYLRGRQYFYEIGRASCRERVCQYV